MLPAILSAAMAVPDFLLGKWTGSDGEDTWQMVFKPAAVQYLENNSSGHIIRSHYSFSVNSTCQADADGISATIIAHYVGSVTSGVFSPAGNITYEAGCAGGCATLECYKYKVAKTQGTQMPDGTEAAWWYNEYTVPHEAVPTFVCPEPDHEWYNGTELSVGTRIARCDDPAATPLVQRQGLQADFVDGAWYYSADNTTDIFDGDRYDYVYELGDKDTSTVIESTCSDESGYSATLLMKWVSSTDINGITQPADFGGMVSGLGAGATSPFSEHWLEYVECEPASPAPSSALAHGHRTAQAVAASPHPPGAQACGLRSLRARGSKSTASSPKARSALGATRSITCPSRMWRTLTARSSRMRRSIRTPTRVERASEERLPAPHVTP